MEDDADRGIVRGCKMSTNCLSRGYGRGQAPAIVWNSCLAFEGKKDLYQTVSTHKRSLNFNSTCMSFFYFQVKPQLFIFLIKSLAQNARCWVSIKSADMSQICGTSIQTAEYTVNVHRKALMITALVWFVFKDKITIIS